MESGILVELSGGGLGRGNVFPFAGVFEVGIFMFYACCEARKSNMQISHLGNPTDPRLVSFAEFSVPVVYF